MKNAALLAQLLQGLGNKDVLASATSALSGAAQSGILDAVTGLPISQLMAAGQQKSPAQELLGKGDRHQINPKDVIAAARATDSAPRLSVPTPPIEPPPETTPPKPPEKDSSNWRQLPAVDAGKNASLLEQYRANRKALDAMWQKALGPAVPQQAADAAEQASSTPVPPAQQTPPPPAQPVPQTTGGGARTPRLPPRAPGGVFQPPMSGPPPLTPIPPPPPVPGAGGAAAAGGASGAAGALANAAGPVGLALMLGQMVDNTKNRAFQFAGDGVKGLMGQGPGGRMNESIKGLSEGLSAPKPAEFLQKGLQYGPFAGVVMAGEKFQKIATSIVGIPKAIEEWGDSLKNSQRRLSQFSGVLAGAYAMSAQKDVLRNIASARATGGSGAEMVKAFSDLKDEMRPMVDGMRTITNVVATQVAVTLTSIVAALKKIDETFALGLGDVIAALEKDAHTPGDENPGLAALEFIGRMGPHRRDPFKGLP